MPPKSNSTPSKDQATQQPSLFILHYKTRRVLVHCPKDYDALQIAIRRYFPEIPPDHRVSYHTNELDISQGTLVEILEDVWDAVIPLLKSLTVEAEPRASTSSRPGKRPLKKADSDCDSSCDERNAPKPPPKKLRRDTSAPSCSAQAPPASASQAQITKKKKLTLNIHQFEGGALQIQCSPSTSIHAILSAVNARMGLEAEARRALWNSKWLVDREHMSVGEYGIMDGDEIWLFRNQVGGKPVIYLFPPTGTQVAASVTLELVPEWRFSAVYPVVPVGTLSSGRQALQWDVEASSDGILVEKNTGLAVSYLFWEAEALVPPSSSAHPSSSVPSSDPTDEPFVPTRARLDPSNAVVLEVAHMTPYLDSALKALGLHTEARTSFITHWLPSFLKHTHIAVRFLPQCAYERAAPLHVSPKPDVVLRVFMLFKGLKAEDLSAESAWMEARRGTDVERWKDVVGVDASQSLADGTLFRVLEWGGMEVVS